MGRLHRTPTPSDDLDLQKMHMLYWRDPRSLLREVSAARWTSKLDDTIYVSIKMDFHLRNQDGYVLYSCLLGYVCRYSLNNADCV